MFKVRLTTLFVLMLGFASQILAADLPRQIDACIIPPIDLEIAALEQKLKPTTSAEKEAIVAIQEKVANEEALIKEVETAAQAVINKYSASFAKEGPIAERVTKETELKCAKKLRQLGLHIKQSVKDWWLWSYKRYGWAGAMFVVGSFAVGEVSLPFIPGTGFVTAYAAIAVAEICLFLVKPLKAMRYGKKAVAAELASAEELFEKSVDTSFELVTDEKSKKMPSDIAWELYKGAKLIYLTAQRASYYELKHAHR